MPTPEAITQSLSRLFDAEREVRRLRDELSTLEVNELLDVASPVLQAALREPDEDEAVIRLVRMADLIGGFEGPRVVDALIDILGSEHPEARMTAGEELGVLAEARFKEVANGVERAIKRLPPGSPALAELPYILAEIPEPAVIRLIGQFLGHSDADAVAAAIESLAEIGDPKAIPMLRPLIHDDRTVDISEEGSDTMSEASLGELAVEAIELLESFEANGEGA